MILNKLASPADETLRTELGANPVAREVCGAVETSTESFEITAEGVGIEIRGASFLANGLPNRARMKVFSPKPGHTLVFFYKKSLLPYSRDRYSYGGIDLRTEEADRAAIIEWLAFVSSGLHPDRRPTNLRRAFPYEIPE